MGKSESARECKRHPNHKFLPGICPSCLRERLLQFHESSNSDAITAIDSFSSEFFLPSESPRRRRHRKNASESAVGSGLVGEKLRKSESIGIVAGSYGGVAGGGKKKGGFWAKLLRRKTVQFPAKVPGEVVG